MVETPNKFQRKSSPKTFSGCFTCRSRKIRCDLHRPSCRNCKRSQLECSGYGVNLRWLNPIRFSPHLRNAVVFPDVEPDKDSGSDFFQRRNVGFVEWDAAKNCGPYKTYEDMDSDLARLKIDPSTDNTRFNGPFGVFPAKSGPLKRQKHLSPASNARSTPTADKATPGFPDLDVLSPDHLWLSTELREHALLTAAALNNDPQYLDFDVSALGYQTVPESQSDLLNLVFHRHLHGQMGEATMGQNIVGDIQLEPDSTERGGTNGELSIRTETHGKDARATTNMNTGASGPHNGRHTDHDSVQSIQGTQAMGGDQTVHGEVSKAPVGDGHVAINPDNQHLFYSNYTNFYYDNPYQLNETLDIQLHASLTALKQDDESTDVVEGETNLLTHMPEAIMAIVRSPLQPKLGFDISLPKNGVSLPSTALQVQPLARYLLNYYATQVADLMTVIPLTENPWKTIYFPRALMAVGELAALGKTSTAKNALLNALLAVAAFNLQSKFVKNSDQMKFYLNLGIRLRNQATVFVRTLLGSHGTLKSDIERCVASEKYKDILCAVMSMISVDLVWGTMQDTNFYIKWCEKVIYTKMTHKKKLSAKAKILHRIFLSLKLIQDSTCLDLANIKEDYDMTSQFDHDVRLRFLGDIRTTPKGKIDYIVDSRVLSPMFVNKKLINTDKNDDNFATDALYGLPTSLIGLFSETVQQLRKKIYHSEAFGNVPSQFGEQTALLLAKLRNWKLDWKLTKDDGTFLSTMHEATYHHIMSFYHALTIYFDRLIQEVASEAVQGKVEQTLQHLNLIQKLIAKDEAHIIPLFWQGFIAGCEAESLNLQMGFKKWGADIAQYLGSYWGARQIMLEVWRRKKMKEKRADWVSVIQDWEMNLMLN